MLIKRLIKFLFFLIAWIKGYRARKQKCPENPKRIFLLMCNWVGDTFWASQTIYELKTRYPNAEIYAGVKPFSRLLFHSMLPDTHLYTLPNVISDRQREHFSYRRFKRNAAKIKRLNIDILLDMTGNRYSAWFTHLAEPAFSVGPDCADEAAPLYSRMAVTRKFDKKHLAYRPKVILAALLDSVISDTLAPPCPTLSPEEITEKYSLRPGERLLMLVPGAGWPTKQWAPERFAALGAAMEKQSFRIVLAGSEKERSLCEGLAAEFRDPLLLINNMEDVISMMPLLTLFVGNDSGPSHLAAATGVQSIVLYCSTNPAFCGALGAHVHYLQSDCPLLPCDGQHFCGDAPKIFCERKECMDISLDKVLKTIREALR